MNLTWFVLLPFLLDICFARSIIKNKVDVSSEDLEDALSDDILVNNDESIANVANSFGARDLHLLEGDIVADEEEINTFYGPQASMSATGAKIQKVSRNNKWPDGIVYYEISRNFLQRERRVIQRAIKEYEDKTCIRFRETKVRSRLFITNNEQGCWSYVGKHTDRSMRQLQPLNLGRGCVSPSTVLHEIGHAIGLWHEQSRPDRDRYIAVHRENIQSSNQYNFNVKRFSDYHGEPYNFGSIMHYGSRAFSKNGLETITIQDNLLYEVQGKPQLGRQRKLSASDVKQINKHYGCYAPNTGPGALQIKILEAGPFQEPGHYYACVRVTDSLGNEREKCTRKDSVSTTDPSWDEELVFEPVDLDAVFHFFDVRVMQYQRFAPDQIAVERQTIWVDFAEHLDSFCVTKALCVPYQYKLLKQ